MKQSDLLLHHPPLVVLDQLLCALDDGEEVILVWVLFAQLCLCAEASVGQEGQKLYFLLGEVRMPEIDDKDQPCFFSLVPGLMLKTIIKHISLSLLLHSSLIAHTHTTSTDASQWQMEPQLLISRPVMLHDVGILGECADERMMVIVGDVFFYHFHNEGYLLTVVIELQVVQLEVKDVPLTTVDRFIADSILSLAFRDPRRSTIGLKALLRSQGEQFISNLLVVVLEVLQPGKLLSSPSLKMINTTKVQPEGQE